MRAIRQHRHGGSEHLALTEAPSPTPGPHDVAGHP